MDGGRERGSEGAWEGSREEEQQGSWGTGGEGIQGEEINRWSWPLRRRSQLVKVEAADLAG